MLEKPPAVTLSEARAFTRIAADAVRVLYATCHSRETAVAPAREWLSNRAIRRVAIDRKEDVRMWHPGLEWIWEAGIYVFDPDINALSVIA